MKRTALFFLLGGLCVFSFLVGSCQRKTANDNTFYSYKVAHQETGLHSAVVSAHPLASQAGAWAMREGGNAFDAAIATQLALAVVYPVAGNIGGGGFMISRDKEGKVRMLDFREKAPLKATEKMYIERDGSVSIDKKEGMRAVGVPGTIDGIFEMLAYAKLSVDKLFEPAIALAKYGFVITEKQALSFNHAQQNIKKFSPPSCPFIRDKWQAGDTLRQPELAATLRLLSQKGRSAFYTGKIAQSLVKQSEKSGGLLAMEDLARYRSIWREPIQFRYQGYTMIVPTLPSSGGILLAQMLGMIAPYAEAGDFRQQHLGAIQVMVEAEKRAYADRATYMGDKDFYNAPLQGMLDTAYIASKMKGFSIGDKAIPVAQLRLPIPQESQETTHLSVVDKEGNAVAVTTTLNGGYGSYVWAEEGGFLLNNEMDDFSAKLNAPNMYGAVEGEGNKIVPEKRMLSSMTPTIVLLDGKLKYVLGSPGGTTIPTSVFQTLVNLIAYRLSPSDAVFSPRFHHQYLPDVVQVEPQFPRKYADSLAALGYHIQENKHHWGRLDLIQVEENGTLTAVGDYRGDDTPDGEK